MSTLAISWTWFDSHILPWVVFNIFVVIMLVLDLKVFHRHAHEIRMREAIGWSIFWIALALAFVIPLYFLYEHYHVAEKAAAAMLEGKKEVQLQIGELTGKQAVLLYLTGYIVEKSLSVDNLFVFLMLFTYFAVKPVFQHRVLFWGILGAILMRAAFILAGVALIHRFQWVLFIFGAFLIVTGVKMAFKSEEEIHPEKNIVLRLCKRFLRTTPQYDGGKFFTRIDGRLLATPMFIVLIVVETTDVVFATDSIPAILGITTDPFIVYSSNIFAILGLRALFFALARLLEIFHLLHYGLAAILVFIGIKMLLEAGHHYPEWNLPSYDVPTGAALGVIGVLLTLSVAASLMFPQKKKAIVPEGGEHR